MKVDRVRKCVCNSWTQSWKKASTTFPLPVLLQLHISWHLLYFPFSNIRSAYTKKSMLVKIPIPIIALWRRQWQPSPVLLPGEYHGRRSLVGYSSWGCWELDMTERLRLHFSLSCLGEGYGNPLQYSCLENPRDRGACWAPVYGVTQSRTWLTWLSKPASNNCSPHPNHIQIPVKTICKNGFSQQLCDKLVEGILPEKNINK